MTSSGPLDERTLVELPLIAQLEAMGWHHLEGDTDVPQLTERESFSQFLLRGRIREAVHAINLDGDGLPWLEDAQVEQALTALERVTAAGGLVAANEATMELLTKGTTVEGPGGRDVPVHYIDFDHPERNSYLVINQFRVDPPGGRKPIHPDVVCFVNGIPLVVIECKSPNVTEPMVEALNQLFRYSNQREDAGVEEGVERMFHYNALMVGAALYDAVASSVGSSYEHFLAWKTTEPVDADAAKAELGVEALTAQELLVAGTLRPEHLLDIVHNFTVFEYEGGRLVKKVTRYQQFRAVHRAIARMQRSRQDAAGQLHDDRGGVIWHTQGSGKSLTMAFLVRKMRRLPTLRRFKVVVVTDRRKLEKQMKNTAKVIGDVIEVAKDGARLRSALEREGAGLVLAMLQKMRSPDQVSTAEDSAVDDETDASQADYPELNGSDEILLLVDEAHRGQGGQLHSNLMTALPKAAKIAFTGTPLLLSEKARTHEIFGPFIDTYKINESQEDGATVEIYYEGREGQYRISDPSELDARLAEDLPDATPQELEAIKRRYVTTGQILEAPKPIEVKAEDMLRHYIDTVMPDGFKAQLAAASRVAAVRYRDALERARDKIVGEIEEHSDEINAIPPAELSERDDDLGFLARASLHVDLIRRLEFAAVISGEHNQLGFLDPWSDPAASDQRIERFEKPLVHENPEKADPLAFLCVKSMLLTGFDAPIEQVLYLDRPMQGVELFQAVARVNRIHEGKEHGLVVDYYGLADRLAAALELYAAEDVEGAIRKVDADLFPKLEARHQRALNIFTDRGLEGISDTRSCVELLADAKVRAEFARAYDEFRDTMNMAMPRTRAVPYLADLKRLAQINQMAATRYRDSGLRAAGAGKKVQALIDKFLEAEGIDPKIELISILDARFDEVVEDTTRSPRAKASEMEHAARHHIETRRPEDPVHYRKLSERLQEILDRLAGQWEEMVEALTLFVDEVRNDERDPDRTGLDPATELPFWRLIVDEADAEDDETARRRIADMTPDVVALIKSQVGAVDFWRNALAQDGLRADLVRLLDAHDAVPFDRLQRTADQLIDIAKSAHTRLIT
jgi:type I restriction enzyme R subunit